MAPAETLITTITRFHCTDNLLGCHRTQPARKYQAIKEEALIMCVHTCRICIVLQWISVSLEIYKDNQQKWCVPTLVLRYYGWLLPPFFFLKVFCMGYMIAFAAELFVCVYLWESCEMPFAACYVPPLSPPLWCISVLFSWFVHYVLPCPLLARLPVNLHFHIVHVHFVFLFLLQNVTKHSSKKKKLVCV